jgi:enamine deaminase RidA (YjgF/YER057c/UK114 family)
MSITRSHTNHRMSQSVVHGNTVYLAGQVAADSSADIKTQTEQVLAKVDALLAEAGTDKTKLLSAQIWLTSMGHYAQINEVWDAWMPEGCAPARACTEARLATPELLVEVGIIAAKD